MGGFNCYPAEIENILCDMPGIARAAVVGVPDERMGEVAKGYLVKDTEAQVDELRLLRGHATIWPTTRCLARLFFWKNFP